MSSSPPSRPCRYICSTVLAVKAPRSLLRSMLLLRSKEEVLLGSEKRGGVEGIERLQLRRWEISDRFCRNPAQQTAAVGAEISKTHKLLHFLSSYWWKLNLQQRIAAAKGFGLIHGMVVQQLSSNLKRLLWLLMHVSCLDMQVQRSYHCMPIPCCLALSCVALVSLI